jgi:hypothetical protein
VRGQVGDGAVGGEDPAVFVGAEAGWVVDVHLDEVLVKAVVAAVPTTRSVLELASVDVDVGTHKTRPWLGGGWLRAQEVALGFLCQGAICLVSGQVGQASPFHHQSADSSESVGG